MRVLLDHCVPRLLGPLLEGHEVQTAAERGWDELRNGELLRAAAEDGFDAMLTVDAGIAHQQDRDSLPLAVVLIRSRSNRIVDVRPLVPAILNAVRGRPPKGFVEVDGRPQRGR
ncbi:MAG: hypothetical protein KDA05_03320 [Phycisphaerales bacterium]|nr:hypothetical protein [Phycisphaerales bacterium]MCB9840620.1 hypothetical protein [Phycisphaeraceae bacterium]